MLQKLTSVPNKVCEYISPKTFLYGMVVVSLFYTGLFLYIFFSADTINKKIEQSLTSKTVDLPAPHASKKPDSKQANKNTAEAKAQKEDRFTLPPAPIDGVYEETSDGLILPQISPRGLTPFMAYKRPRSSSANTPTISLAITDYGLSQKLSEKALSILPPDISLIVSPYASDIENWQKNARKSGHELWIYLPFQTLEYPRTDPGPLGLFTHNSLNKNKNNLMRLLSKTSGYSGVALKSDSAFSGNISILSGLMNIVFSRGLGVLELNTPDIHNEKISSVAKNNGGAYGHVSITLENKSLKRLETIAREQGKAIAYLPLTSKILQTLPIWIKTLSAKGIALAPLSATIPAPPSIMAPDDTTLSSPSPSKNTKTNRR